MEFFNSLNLTQIKGGTKLKQGDLGSVLSYSLTDENGQEITSFDNKTAYINLVLDDKIWFTTTTLVDISRVTFRIDKAIPIGLYYLEIKIDDYIFPSDRDSIILIEEGSTPYDLKELVPNYDINMTLKGILSDLSQKGIDISDLKTKMKAIYNNALADHAEVAKARGTEATLGDRLQSMDGKISQTTTDITRTEARIDGLIANAGNGTVPSELTDMRVAVSGKKYSTAGEAVRNQFKNVLMGDRMISSPSDLVSPYNDLNTLPTNSIVLYAYYGNVLNKPVPGYEKGAIVQTINYNGSSRLGAIQILTHEDGTMYNRIFWKTKNGVDQWSKWNRINTDTNVLSGDRQIGSSAELVAPYNDLNTLPFNKVITYAHYGNVLNKPDAEYLDGATVFTVSYTRNTSPGAFQLLIQVDGTMYHRIYWHADGRSQWLPWKKNLTEQDLPQNTDTDPFQPSLALFEKIGVIGDSYSSGEIYPDGPSGFDNYNLSWGQILARKNGVKCVNFSKGGLTTRSWLTDSAGLAKLNSTEPQNLYYVSLGINDNNALGTGYIGAETDMDSGADTFYGNYSKIIKAIQAKAPNAKIILIDSASTKSDTDPFFVATKNIATKFGLPLIKHRDDSFLASDKFKKQLMVYGHPVAISYAAMASAFERLTMQAIRDNIEYFKDYRG